MHLALALTLALTSSAHAGGPLNLAQLTDQIIHHAWNYQGRENGRDLAGTIVYRRDGKMLILTDQGYRDGGTWRLQSPDRLCTRVRDFRQSAEMCFAVSPAGEGRYTTSHGFALYVTPDRSFEGA
ncbi:MAG: hypothetical protein AAGB18_09215 [Pseudomonadota bacterium]